MMMSTSATLYLSGLFSAIQTYLLLLRARKTRRILAGLLRTHGLKTILLIPDQPPPRQEGSVENSGCLNTVISFCKLPTAPDPQAECRLVTGCNPSFERWPAFFALSAVGPLRLLLAIVPTVRPLDSFHLRAGVSCRAHKQGGLYRIIQYRPRIDTTPKSPSHLTLPR